MSEMIERVSLAIANNIHRNFDAMARAAIAEMREPTNAMLDAEMKQSVAPNNDEGDEWRAMIDAALVEQNTTETNSGTRQERGNVLGK